MNKKKEIVFPKSLRQFLCHLYHLQDDFQMNNMHRQKFDGLTFHNISILGYPDSEVKVIYRDVKNHLEMFMPFH